MSLTSPVVGDVKLEKDVPTTSIVVPGTPGHPGDPGTPATPAYDSFETRHFPDDPPPIGFVYDLDADFNVILAPERFIELWHSELGQFVREVIPSGYPPGSAYIVTIHHPATPGTPDDPGEPGTPSTVLADNGLGWDAIGVLDGYVIAEGSMSFFAKNNMVGAAVGAATVPNGTDPSSLPHAFYFERGHFKIIEGGLTVFDGDTYNENDKFTLKLRNWDAQNADVNLRRNHVLTYLVNNDVVYTSAVQPDGVLSLIALLYAPVDAVYNASYRQSNSIYAAASMAPLRSRQNGMASMEPLRIINSGFRNAIHVASRMEPLAGIGADVPNYAYSFGKLEPLFGHGQDSVIVPVFNASRGFLTQLRSFGLGIAQQHGNSAAFILGPRVLAADIPNYSAGSSYMAPLRMRPTLPFLHLMISSALGASSSMASEFRLVALVNASGAVSMFFTVNINSLGLIASRMGISSAFDVSALMFALISSRLGITSEPLQLSDTEDAIDVWVVNTDTNATTRYESFDFNSYALIDGRYYGARDGGIFLLEGDNDNGAPIRASINFGKQNFGTTNEKRVPNAYIGSTSTGLLVMKVIVEGQEYLYTARDGSEQLQTQRFDFGKGLKANFFEFEIYNDAGEDFEISSVEFVPVNLSRRIG